MAEKKNVRLADVVGLINQISPPHLAEEWDNVGLQIGDPNAVVQRILLCLDISEAVIDEAERLDVQLIIAHHPLIFRPLNRLTPVDSQGSMIYRCIRRNIAVVAAHTNLDRAANGLNDWLAEQIGLRSVRILERPRTDAYLKLIVYVPSGHENVVMDAMFQAGAGHIGAYDRCSFRTIGTGTFRGGKGTDPFIGSPGIQEEADELRLETIVPTHLRERVVARMIKAHPYEEVAYDLVPLANPDNHTGLGRIGVLAAGMTLKAFARQVKETLEVDAVRMVGHRDQLLNKVAVCGGAGIGVYADALRHGADCLVTGDIKFHEAQRALAGGMTLIDAGHYGTEKIMVAGLSRRLTDLAVTNGYPLEIFSTATEKDPFVTLT